MKQQEVWQQVPASIEKTKEHTAIFTNHNIQQIQVYK